MQNHWNLYVACKQQQLYGSVNYRDFRETGPKSENGLKIDIFWSEIDSGFAKPGETTNNSQEYPLPPPREAA